MPRYAPNKMSQGTKRKYFELIRSGFAGQKLPGGSACR